MSPVSVVGDRVTVYVPFQKVDEDERMVVGYATTEALDSDGERVRRQAVENAWPDYMKFGNIREMHQPIAAGKVVEAHFDDKGPKIKGHVVDDNAWRKVKAGVYSGYSIGGKIKEKHGEWVTEIEINEISLVDRPANPEAVFELIKFNKGDAKVDKQDMRIREQAVEILQQVAGGIRNVAKSVRMEGVVSKGLGTAVAFLDQISGLKYLCDMIQGEEMLEGHQGFYDQLKENVADISGTAGAYVMEQLAEMNDGAVPIPVGTAPNDESDVAAAYTVADGVEKMADAMTAKGQVFTKEAVEQLENLNREIAKMDLQNPDRPDKKDKPIGEGTGWQKAWGPEPDGWAKMDSITKASFVKVAETAHKGAGKMDDDKPDGDKMGDHDKTHKDANGDTVTGDEAKNGTGWARIQAMMDDDHKTAMEGESDDDNKKKMEDDHKRRMGYMERAYKMEPMDDKPETEKMAKVVGLTQDLAKSQARVKELEKMDVPAKAKARVFALSKGEDVGDQEVDGLKKRQQDAEKKGDARELIKMVHQGAVNDGLPEPSRPDQPN